MKGVPEGQRERITLHDLGASGKSLVPTVLAVTAVRNILDNALRYSPQDKPVILTIAASEGMMNFAVEHSGPGMSEAECAQSLNRFWRKGRGHGSGLGLSIVAAIAERYGGNFELRPLPGGGVRARIGFPVA